MNAFLNRRDFLAVSAAAATATLAAGRSTAAGLHTKPHKAVLGSPTEAMLRNLKEAGFEGIESLDRGASPKDAAQARKTAEKLGMRIHGVLYGWANFNQADAVARDLASVEVALRAAQAYGASTILLVPCRISGMPMPEAWDLDIRFDEKTGHVKQVIAGDNARYQKYIEAHNHATDTSRAAVRQLIPVAEKTGILIALENVWNGLWLKPDIFQNFVASFDNPWIRAYFDIGNHVKFAPPQEWIRKLGKLIVKCHVKDFKLNANGHGGNFVQIREGSVDWPAVRQALDDLDYESWMSIEDLQLPLAEGSRRLDLILAGK
ncbi:MAG: sugar phosphate isomerase/epimerase family protein [Thermoguttaceae bacterium]|jgi:hexulose-6-phosphate isomerase